MKMLDPLVTYTMNLVDVSKVYKHVHVPVRISDLADVMDTGHL
jgi:hypothetical protein